MANEDFPILTFDQDLSSCLDASAMDTVASMDTQLLLYDIPHSGADVIAKATKGNTNSFPDLPDLDPSLEISHNLQDLINNPILDTPNNSNTLFIGTESVLFPELLQQLQESNERTEEVEEETETESNTSIIEPMPEVSSNSLFQGNQAAQVIVLSSKELSALGLQLDGDSFSLLQAADGDEGSVTEAALPEPEVVACTSQRDTRKNTLKAEAPSRTASRRSRQVEKHTDEYRQRRERNNVAVRKSRDKAKNRQQETESKVSLLTDENERLQKKVDLLSKELAVLKGLFTNVGADLPTKLAMLLK